jgi:sugar phosphate isomerase/epimerase
MQLGVFAKTFEGAGALPVLRAVAAAGFECAQFNLACCGLASMPEAIGRSVSSSIADAALRTGVRIVAISGTYNMIHPDRTVRVEGLARLRVLAQACKDIGTDLVTLCTGTRDPTDLWRKHSENASALAWHDLCLEMEQAIRVADQFGVYLGIEPELANVVSSSEKARRIIDEMQSDRLRIVLDPANLFEIASKAEQHALIRRSIELLSDRIALAHAKDRARDGTFAAAGTGIIDFAYFVRTLRSSGFDGPLVAHGLTAAQAKDTALFLRKILRNTASTLGSGM